MKANSITAKIGPKDDQPAKSMTVEVPLPETLEECVEVYGDEAVYSNVIASCKITLQAAIRRAITSGKSVEDTTADLAEWKLGVAMRKAADPMGKLLKSADNMDPEQIKALMAQLKSKLQG